MPLLRSATRRLGSSSQGLGDKKEPKMTENRRISTESRTTEPVESANTANGHPLRSVEGQPPAWADFRPELSDTLPWFRAVQGGVYHSDGYCWGFILDADCGDRSYMNDEIIITRAGGGCVKDADGNLILTKDQDNDHATLASLFHSKTDKVPVGLIIGDRNTVLDRTLPHRYNVLAYFQITDIWFEKMGQKRGAKVRFEKLDLSVKSWWAAKGSPLPIAREERDYDTRPEVIPCSNCNQSSQRIYNEGWMCLYSTCKLFWTINGSAPPKNLTFHDDFLNCRSPPDPEMQPWYSLVPNLLSTINPEDRGVSSLRIAWKGIVCPLCSKCIPRRFWGGWKCTDGSTIKPGQTNGHCPFQKIFAMPPISLRSVIDDFELSPIKRILKFDPKFAVPNIDDSSAYPYRRLTYTISGAGWITHFVSNKAINSRLDGPNDLFCEMQATELGLRRHPLQQSVVAGTLTAHFAVNYGMPYKFVVSVDSKGFSEAADCVLRALGRLTWATEEASAETGKSFMSPNELLILGYLEGMKIGYHDDGESSLGPTIATLSLGAKSTMFIRMKYKYYHGFSRAKKLLDDDPVLPGCVSHRERQELKDRFLKSEINKAEYDELRWGVLKKSRNGEASPIIKMELNHGDMIVMHGEELQKYYEHSVIPDNKLRFALTARHIKAEFVDKEGHRKGDFTLSPSHIYDGK